LAILLIRTVIVYVSITAALRLMGKRQMGELELNELVVAILISDLAVNPLQDTSMSMLRGLAPVGVLFLCEILVSGLILRSLRFRTLICGRPSILVENGVIDQREMRRNRFTIDELAEELRAQGITDLRSVRYAVLETDGRVSILLRPDCQPATAGQLGLAGPDTGYTTILINDGKLLPKNLARTGHDRAWLERALRSHGVSAPEAVYLMTVNGAGEVYLLPKAAEK